jgi:hypothetical protein
VRHVLLSCSLLAFATLAACAADTDSSPSNASLEVVVDGTPLQLDQKVTLTAENRDARVAILKGVVERDGTYKAELVRVLDAPAYVDVDLSVDGDPFWIAQASVEDAQGNVLWTDRVNSMFQLLEFLEIVVEQSSNLTLNRAQLYTFIGQQYPALYEFPVKVPVGISGGKSYVLKVPNADDVLTEVARFDIEELMDQAVRPSVEGRVNTIFRSGPSDERLDIVILGDGYREEDQAQFDLDVQKIAERLQETEPYASEIGLINVHSVFTPSVEKGAGYDCTGIPSQDAGCRNDLRDTVFGTTFVITALADRLNIELGQSDRVAMPLEIGRLFDVAVQAEYDEVIMISNTKRYSGFAGIYVSVITTYGGNRNLMADVAMHELGHSFGALGDEYQVAGDPCLFNEPRVPLPANIAAYTEGGWKWDRWFSGDVPIPTPPNQYLDFPIGAYEGAYNCDFLYRPARECKMKSDESLPYCSVCTEQLMRRFYAAVDPVVSPSVERLEDGKLQFSVDLAGEGRSARWTFNGADFGEGPSVMVGGADVDADENVLQVTVTDSSGRVRVEDPRATQSFEWTVGVKP